MAGELRIQRFKLGSQFCFARGESFALTGVGSRLRKTTSEDDGTDNADKGGEPAHTAARKERENSENGASRILVMMRLSASE